MRYHRVPASALLRAIVRAVLLYWCVLTLTFALLRLAPGDTASLLVPPGASAADVARLRTQLGLDRPMAVQYGHWLGQSLGDNMGQSFAAQRAVRFCGSVCCRPSVRAAWRGTSAPAHSMRSVRIGCVRRVRRVRMHFDSIVDTFWQTFVRLS